MRELLRTVDPVLVSFVEALLADARITYHVADANTSVMEGSICAFPRRILVATHHYDDACRLMGDAGIGLVAADWSTDTRGASWPNVASWPSVSR